MKTHANRDTYRAVDRITDTAETDSFSGATGRDPHVRVIALLTLVAIIVALIAYQ